MTEPITEVKIYNTNIDKMIIAEIPVENGVIQYEGQFSIAGVPGESSKIMLNFPDAGGTFTRKTLPTGNAVDTVQVSGGRGIEISIVDCVNTIVFVRARDVGLAGTELREGINGNAALLDTLEQVRVGGGILAGLIRPDEPVGPGTHSLPKLVIVAEPADYVTSAHEMIRGADIDILSRYISMGGLHKAHAVGGALALAAACQIPGTIPNRLAATSGSAVRIGHPSGTMYAEAAVARTASSDWLVTRAAYGRTARRLMAGDAYIPAAVLASAT